jgi:fumarate reductase subunit C
MHTVSSPATQSRVPAYPWRQPRGWYMTNKRYFAYMVREMTAVFAALWVILFLVQIPAMGAGRENLVAHQSWLEFIHAPGWVLFNVIAFALVGYHSLTWFRLMGTVMWMRFGKAPVPANLIVTSMFIAWALVSLVVAFFIATPVIGG